MVTEIHLPLDEMTDHEKEDVIDYTMDDLSRNRADVPVIGWHGDALAKRAADMAAGGDKFISLADAEQRIREKTGHN